ncbi:hypothetical protein E6C50_15905 [Flavobacterium supellecticarium]|uniref:Uncharacterized protein n=1 Tax=Flavobacterium supellecticarium TaxID=2565924 RepID=A0A4S3ZQU8_9FLAO|nr:T3SS effector HopA1 family protein [Flavobacterium supellecticarium]THF47916.1 hypothetical protein E6C50_15905 [Flavobacterium supellecticarium]
MFKDKTILKELTRIIDQIKIEAMLIHYNGKSFPVTSENAVIVLTSLLYSECYMLKERYQLQPLQNFDLLQKDASGFMHLLSQNNHTKEKLEQGWEVQQTYTNGYVGIVRNNEKQIVNASAIKKLAPGEQTVSVLFPKEDRYRQPTFYYAFSNAPMDTITKLVRIYWNCTCEGAPVLLDILTTRLNQYNIPFLFKCLSHPEHYFRRDAAVLYIDDSLMPLLERVLPELVTAMEPYLEEDVPLFSYRHSKGVGIAENPSAQESFGMNRMTIVAETLLKTASKKLPSEAILREIAIAFQKKGINPLTTHLNKGSKILFN